MLKKGHKFKKYVLFVTTWTTTPVLASSTVRSRENLSTNAWNKLTTKEIGFIFLIRSRKEEASRSVRTFVAAYTVARGAVIIHWN